MQDILKARKSSLTGKYSSFQMNRVAQGEVCKSVVGETDTILENKQFTFRERAVPREWSWTIRETTFSFFAF